MAQYEHLPIYKITYDLLIRVMYATKQFPREYKYTLGQRIKDEITELVVLIYRANSSPDKSLQIQAILDRIQVIQLLSRLCHDLHIMQVKHYAIIAGMADKLGRQAQGWLKASRGSGKAEPEWGRP